MAKKNKSVNVATLISEVDSAFTSKGTWETLWQDCIDFCDPVHSGITEFRSKGEENQEARIIDDCIIGLGEFTAGMYSSLCVGEFTKLAPANKASLREPKIAQWWNDTSSVVLSKIESSNFKNEITQVFHSLGSIGTSAIGVELIDNEYVFRCYDITEYAIAENNKGLVDSFYRKMEFNAKQAIQEFGYDKVSSKVRGAFEKNDASTKFMFYHIIKPRSCFLTGKTKQEKPIASYWVDKETKMMVREGGFDTMPVCVGRAMKSSKEVYGKSPMSNTLATARELQHIKSSIKLVNDLKAHPNWLIDKQAEVENITSAKDEITYWNSRKSSNPPVREQVNIDLGVTFEETQSLKQDIMNAFYVPLFDALRDRRNMTATEAQERVSTALLKIAPMSARIVSEILTPLIERCFMLVLLKDGELSPEDRDFPAYPEGHEEPTEFKATFYGKLSQLSEELALANMGQGLNFVLQYAEAIPSMLDYINGDEIAKIGLVNSSAPSEILYSEKEVEATRKARAEQAQKQEQMQAMSVGADAISKTGAKPETGSPASNIMEQLGGMSE